MEGIDETVEFKRHKRHMEFIKTRQVVMEVIDKTQEENIYNGSNKLPKIGHAKMMPKMMCNRDHG